MYEKLLHDRWARLLGALFGAFLSAVGINLFIVPQGLYSAGVMGMCQVLRTLLVRAGLEVSFDVAGVLYLIVNIPLMALAWHSMGKKFFFRMVLCTAANSLFVSIVPQVQIVDDMLTSCLIGGILCGFAGGLILTCGGSTGGLDIIGLYMSKRGKSTVGRIALVFNLLLYCVCALLFSLPVALYSAVYSVFSSLFVDRLHQQNIAVQILIFTKNSGESLRAFIMNDLNRGVTYWNGGGGYTHAPLQVLCVCLSKYEVVLLRQAAQEIDPDAFLIVNEGVHMHGNFERHLN